MAMRGVNLGGWLVLEKWMTPALFAGTDARDEYEFIQTPGGAKKLRKHHETFIQESDFAWLSEHAIEMVRIPVGYWILTGDEPYVPAIDRLDWAFRMAKKYNIEVLLCLHGAPGSQNGQDHSGKVGEALWYKEPAYREQTIDVLERLATRYRTHPRFWGIELMNEPKFGLFQLTLRRFYREAHARLEPIVRPSTKIVFHDAFTPRLMNAVLGGPLGKVYMDIHWYHFTFLLYPYVPLYFYWWLVRWHGRLLARLRHWQGIVIGEWSGVISHRLLRHYPSEQHEKLQHENIARQLQAYSAADAWCYWTYKTEAPGIWNYRSLVDDLETAELFSIE